MYSCAYFSTLFSNSLVASWTTRGAIHGSIIRPIRPRIHRAISEHRYSQITRYCSTQTRSSAIDSNQLEHGGLRALYKLNAAITERDLLLRRNNLHEFFKLEIFERNCVARERFISVLLILGYTRVIIEIKRHSFFVAYVSLTYVTVQIGRNRDKNFREIRSEVKNIR